jgi:hypothetical protein
MIKNSKNKLKKLAFYRGYITGGSTYKENLPYEQNGDLMVGKKYLTEEYTVWESHSGNGGSSYNTQHTYLKAYSLKGKLIEDGIWPSAFIKKIDKNCKHINRARLSHKSGVQRCHGCFKKFKTISKLVEIK